MPNYLALTLTRPPGPGSEPEGAAVSSSSCSHLSSFPFSVPPCLSSAPARLCIRLCHRVRRKNDEDGGDRLRRCEEGFCDCDCEEEEEKEVGLLQRYLEDQIRLVGSVYECGDEFDHLDDGDDQTDHDHNLNAPLLG
ncbi:TRANSMEMBRANE PROTEIN [Salix koriyanagi]|uniref:TRANSMEMBRANE PROTEIN n=1 Tax=Salix koriyanagi TaxID=2511006 RepID=A0A9Q1A8T3_9ROSI|nr:TRANSMEMBRANE PROTEIN [Salix koriyanagi]